MKRLRMWRLARLGPEMEAAVEDICDGKEQRRRPSGLRMLLIATGIGLASGACGPLVMGNPKGPRYDDALCEAEQEEDADVIQCCVPEYFYGEADPEARWCSDEEGRDHQAGVDRCCPPAPEQDEETNGEDGD